MEGILMKVSDETLDEMVQSLKGVNRASDKMAIIFPIVLEKTFPKMKGLMEMVEEAQNYAWCFCEILFIMGFMAYDGSYNWQEFKQHVEIVKKVKAINTRDASKKPDGYMAD